MSAESLSREAVLEALDRSVRGRVSVELFRDVDSTNRRLLDAPIPPEGALSVCLAEGQSAGRGRRGRAWWSPPGAGLYLSVGWQFRQHPKDLPALALATGVVARRVIRDQTDLAVDLKWPNDLVWGGRKLGGVLVEMRAARRGPCHAVVGLGINVALPVAMSAAPADWRATVVDLHEATAGAPPSRLSLAAGLIEALSALMEGYEHTGFTPYHREFEAADCLRGRAVELDGPDGRLSGRATRVDVDGALVVDTAAGVYRVISGEASVRARA